MAMPSQQSDTTEIPYKMNGVLHIPELCDVTYSLHITMVNYR